MTAKQDGADFVEKQSAEAVRRLVKPLIDRLLSKSEVHPITGCWLWTGCKTKDGYGRIHSGLRLQLVHRVSYELHVEPIPPGLEIDHLCRVRHCVNPAHLEPVTHAENVRRGNFCGNGALERARTHCPQGHPYDEQNTRICPNGGRACRACDRTRKRKEQRHT